VMEFQHAPEVAIHIEGHASLQIACRNHVYPF
jgi:hypothetical protein